jgi:hypothetical protein
MAKAKLTRVKVLKPFPYGHDGVNIENLEEDDVRDVHTDLVDGLGEEGFIELAPGASINGGDDHESDEDEEAPAKKTRAAAKR